jgi:DNA polymerase-3 subunit alpha
MHLHTTTGSIGDSILRIPELVEKAAKLNIKALALTNHGSLADMYDFYFECVKHKIKPIIGCEVYVTDNRLEPVRESNHLILLAKNLTGVKNLLNITSNAQLEGFYYKPRTDLNYIKEYSEGLICLTACVGGKVPQLILQDDIEGAVGYIKELDSIFENVYLEIQPGDFEDQAKVNNKLIELSSELNIPLVASNDIHYLDKNDWKAHDFHVRSFRKQKAPEDYNETLYPDKKYYLMERAVLLESFGSELMAAADKAIDNTNVIADMCDVEFDNSSLNLPEFDCPEGYTTVNYIEHLCFEKLEKIKNKIKNPNEYVSRLYYELEVINELGFISYFLIMWDLLKYAKDNNIKTGPGRGSVCGSLAAYLLDITKIDPIRYDLMFERFLSVHRKGSIPDIDTDFQSDKRQMMFDYTIETYDLDKCAAVSTFQIRKAKSAIKDVARLLGIDLKIAEAICKLIPMTYYDDEGEKLTDLSLTESLEVVVGLREYRDIYPELFDMAIKLEGLPRATSIHAAGTLIAKKSLIEVAPLVRQENKSLNATAFDLKQAERAMLVKYDYLGLSTLNVLDMCERKTGVVFDMEFDKFDDESIWDLIGSKNTTGLFQIASKTYKDRMFRLRPRTIEQLAACLALVRGPCISAKTDERYMRIVEGKEEIELIHPLYDSATADTNGILLYQEQLMQICVNFGFSLEEGFRIMKASSKKKFDVLKKYEAQFMELANKKEVPINIADKIFKMIVDSGLYSFNKSHAVAYAVLCYATAYYKLYHPVEFMASELTNIYLNVATDKRPKRIEETVSECRALGIKFLPVSMNKSDWDFDVEDGAIRIGLGAISSFGHKAAEGLLKLRPFENMEDFIERAPKSICNKKAAVSLIMSGALGDRVENYLKFCESRRDEPLETINIHNKLQVGLYDEDFEVESGMLGEAYTTSPVNNMKPVGYKDLKNNTVFTMSALVKRVSKKRDKSNNMMCFFTLETGDGTMESVMFSGVYDKYKSFAKKGLIIDVKVKKQDNENCIILEVV